MIGEELRQRRDQLAADLGRVKQETARYPDNPAAQLREADAENAFHRAEIKLLQHIVRLFEGTLRRRRGCSNCNSKSGAGIK